MTIGVWEPSATAVIDLPRLEQFITVAKRSQLQNLSASVDVDFQTENSQFMQRPMADWQTLTLLVTEDLMLLARFFTLAEVQLNGWDAGKTSPVIYIVKELKKRGEFDAELRKWIKLNTDNRYLPNGAIL